MTDAELQAEESAMPSRQRERPRGRELPKDPEMEICLLACAVMDAQRVHVLIQEMGVRPEWFHFDHNRIVFETWLEIMEAGKPFDIFILTKLLRDRKLLDKVGGPAFVTQLATYLPTVANARMYAETIGEKFTLRSVIKVATEAIEGAYDRQDDPSAVVAQLEQAATGIALARYKPRGDTVYDAVGRIIEKCNSGDTEAVRGLSTGFDQLDEICRGLAAGSMWAIGGQPGTGKTSFAMNIVHHLSVRRQDPIKTLIISCEQNVEEVTEVLIQIGSGVNMDSVASGESTEVEARAFAKAAHEIAHAPITIRDETDISIVQVRSIARTLKPRLIVIDYAQLLTGGKKKYERNDLEIADISRGAKNMAGELGCTVLLLSQVNDDGKTSGSRSISKDANQVLVIEEPENKNQRIVKICKQRRGKKAMLTFGFLDFAQKFTERH